MRTFALIVIVLALGSACDSDSPTAPGDGPFALESVVKVSYSGYTGPLRATIRTNADWAEAWTTLHAGLQPMPPRPPIDFDQSFVVLAAAGTRPDGCYSIEITNVVSSIEGQPVFDVRETQPGPNCVCTQATTQPAHAIQVRRFSGDAEFLERVVELRC